MGVSERPEGSMQQEVPRRKSSLRVKLPASGRKFEMTEFLGHPENPLK